MWLTNSSIGRKFIMAITGCALVLFVTFHVLMNAVALIWPGAYNQVCEFLGANWYALIASAGLALLFIIHIVYALWLTMQNYKARGNDRYAINGHAPQVEWSSKNMLVLGIVVLAFLVVHLIQFWAKMQLQELIHADLTVLPQVDGVPAAPAMGTLFIQAAFAHWYTPVIYIIGFIALWFHMNHGFWSMLQTVGWNNTTWLPRTQKIACWWTSIVVALFIAQAVVFTVQANKDYYLESPALQEQYAEFWNEQSEEALSDFQNSIQAAMKDAEGDQIAAQKAQQDFVESYGPGFITRVNAIKDAFEKQCPNAVPGDAYRQVNMIKSQIERMLPPDLLPKAEEEPAAEGANN